MSETNDNLIQCPHCEGNMCYEYQHKDYNQWMCFNCGYGSTSHMTKDSDFVKLNKETMPELVKDLEFIAEDDLVWYPSVINVPEKGILFPNGSSKDAWGWSVAPLIQIEEEEKSRFPKNQTHKVDLKGMENFPKEMFTHALDMLHKL
jgi:hypothetical protein